MAIAESPGYGKATYGMAQVPVVITLATQDDIADWRPGVKWTDILKRALVRAAHDADAQGGVWTTSDLSVLFHRAQSWVAQLIRPYQSETGQILPRRGNIHAMGRTVTPQRLICRQAYLEGKTRPVIARETYPSPQAVDHYIRDFAPVYFATMQPKMSIEETVFAIQPPRYLVQE